MARYRPPRTFFLVFSSKKQSHSHRSLDLDDLQDLRLQVLLIAHIVVLGVGEITSPRSFPLSRFETLKKPNLHFAPSRLHLFVLISF